MKELTQHIRHRIYHDIDENPKNNLWGQFVNAILVLIICISVVTVMLESVPELNAQYGKIFYLIDVVTMGIFVVEYIIRVWVSVENPRFQGKRFPRIRYMFTPMALIDFIAISPLFISLIFPVVDLRMIRVLRVMRILKLTRYSPAMNMITMVLQREIGSLIAAIFILIVLLIIAASGMYIFEHQAQPENFRSIPATLWWAVVTLTTVGYGDVYPITDIGRIFGALVMMTGVGFAALPAGILASGLSDELHRRRDQFRQEYHSALGDGKIDEDEAHNIEEMRKELGISNEVATQIYRDAYSRLADQKLVCPHCHQEFLESEAHKP